MAHTLQTLPSSLLLHSAFFELLFSMRYLHILQLFHNKQPNIYTKQILSLNIHPVAVYQLFIFCSHILYRKRLNSSVSSPFYSSIVVPCIVNVSSFLFSFPVSFTLTVSIYVLLYLYFILFHSQEDKTSTSLLISNH